MYVWFGEVLVCLVFETVSYLEFAVTCSDPPASVPPLSQITGLLHHQIKLLSLILL